MAITVFVPPIFGVGDGSKGAFTLVGNANNGQDLHIELGSAPKTVTLKRSGTLLDDADAAFGITVAGSALIAQSNGLNTAILTAITNMTSATLQLVMVNVPAAVTVTGIAFMQSTQGVYTATNYNGVGLYSYNGAGTLTLIASSTNNGNIWKTVSGTFHQEPFSATVDLVAGVYWMAALWNGTTITTTPALLSSADGQAMATTLDFPSNAKTYGTVGAQTTLPASQAFSGVAGDLKRMWFALY
jgi:hypothetical protein